MWEADLPGVDDHLRQGDLITDQFFPRRGTLTLSEDGVRGDVRKAPALVLERCCSVEHKHTVLLAKVGKSRDLDPEHPYMQALGSVESVAGSPYAWYEHLLEPRDPGLLAQPQKIWVTFLLERVSIAARDHDGLAELRVRRIARMTPPARAQLRAKLAAHFGAPEPDDRDWLTANGYDPLGRLID